MRPEVRGPYARTTTSPSPPPPSGADLAGTPLRYTVKVLRAIDGCINADTFPAQRSFQGGRACVGSAFREFWRFRPFLAFSGLFFGTQHLQVETAIMRSMHVHAYGHSALIESDLTLSNDAIEQTREALEVTSGSPSCMPATRFGSRARPRTAGSAHQAAHGGQRTAVSARPAPHAKRRTPRRADPPMCSARLQPASGDGVNQQ